MKLKELKEIAKKAKIKGWYKMNKSELQRNLSGLKRWYNEDWVDENGNPCGSNKKRIKKCRPNKRITNNTPIVWNELSKKKKDKIIKEKKKIGMGKKAPSIKNTRKKVKISLSAKPKNKKLYEKVKTEAKKKYKIFPSAYASGWIVQEYKRRGGKYI